MCELRRDTNNVHITHDTHNRTIAAADTARTDSHSDALCTRHTPRLPRTRLPIIHSSVGFLSPLGCRASAAPVPHARQPAPSSLTSLLA